MNNDSVFDWAIDLQKSYRKVMPMAAIWFDHGIETGTERTPRITKGHLLRIENNKVVDVSADLPATHKVTNCLGNISNTILLLELENLKSGETLTLNLK